MKNDKINMLKCKYGLCYGYYPKVLDDDSKKYERLVTLSGKLNAQCKGVFYVSDCYFDFGQGMMWTTIIRDEGNGIGSYQFLSSNEMYVLLNSNENCFREACDIIIEDCKGKDK